MPATKAFGWSHKRVCDMHRSVYNSCLDNATRMWTIHKTLHVYIDQCLTHSNAKFKRLMQFLVRWGFKFHCIKIQNRFFKVSDASKVFLGPFWIISYTFLNEDVTRLDISPRFDADRKNRYPDHHCRAWQVIASHILGSYCLNYGFYMLGYREKQFSHLSFSLTKGTFEYQSIVFTCFQWKANIFFSKHIHLVKCSFRPVQWYKQTSSSLFPPT